MRPRSASERGFAVGVSGPFDLSLSLRAASRFTGGVAPDKLRIVARVGVRPVILEVSQKRKDPPLLWAASSSGAGREVRSIAAYVLQTDLDLSPFYEVALRDRRLGPVVRELWGLRPLRPASLFEMLITAITEQQISMRVAEVMRHRLTSRFGGAVDGAPVFPDAGSLKDATLDSLVGCGLSRRKAEYVRGISKMVSSGELDLEALKRLPDDEAFRVLTGVRGVGPWTADYVLVRGMGRLDRVPVEDLGIGRAVGKYLGEGRRVEDPGEVLPLLRPFAPYRGLAAYYLLVHERLGAVPGAATRGRRQP